MATSTEIVLNGTHAAFVDRDLNRIDEYFGPVYTQHSSVASDGVEGLKQFVGSLPEDFAYDCQRVLTDGDLVALHGRYHGLGAAPLVAFDIFRVADGRIVEHWDALQPEVTETVSGASMLDGPTGSGDASRTEETRRVVEDMVDTILIRGELDQLGRLFDGDSYVQHNPGIGHGLSGLGAALEAMAAQGVSMVYDRRHLTIAEGDLGLVQSEGSFGGRPTIFYDLFRVQDGRIAEHWDVIFTRPDELPHGNGLF